MFIYFEACTLLFRISNEWAINHETNNNVQRKRHLNRTARDTQTPITSYLHRAINGKEIPMCTKMIRRDSLTSAAKSFRKLIEVLKQSRPSGHRRAPTLQTVLSQNCLVTGTHILSINNNVAPAIKIKCKTVSIT